MKDWKLNLAPALVAVAVIAGAVVLAAFDHAQVAAALLLVGVVAHAFLPPVATVTKDGAP